MQQEIANATIANVIKAATESSVKVAVPWIHVHKSVVGDSNVGHNDPRLDLRPQILAARLLLDAQAPVGAHVHKVEAHHQF